MHLSISVCIHSTCRKFILIIKNFRTYYKNKVLTHDIFKWVIYFENNKLPRISHYNIKQPNNSKNICDPTSVIEVNNKKYLVTAETNQHWFVDQDYITNVYEME